MRGAAPCGVCVLPVPNEPVWHSQKEQEHLMDKQSVTNVRQCACIAHWQSWVLMQAAHLTPQLPVVPLDPKELI